MSLIMWPAMLHISKCMWFDVVRSCGMKMTVKSCEVMRISRQLSTVEIIFYQSSWAIWNIVIMYVAWKQIMQVVGVKLNPWFPWQKILSTSQLDLNLRKKLLKWYILCIALNGTETDKLREINQKYLGSYEMWWWRRIETISYTDHVKKE